MLMAFPVLGLPGAGAAKAESMEETKRQERAALLKAAKEWEVKAARTVVEHVKPASSIFVVVGAHGFATAGELNDNPFFVRLATQHPWAAVVLIEASPMIASRLEANLVKSGVFSRAKRLVVSNAGICPVTHAEGMPFYSVTAKMATGDARLPGFTDQFGSFNRQHIDRHVPHIKDYMDKTYPEGHNWTLSSLAASVRETSVPCRTLPDELRRHGLVDLPIASLLIDTEGLDCGIIATLDLCTVHP